jgi:hypothetical protein
VNQKGTQVPYLTREAASFFQQSYYRVAPYVVRIGVVVVLQNMRHIWMDQADTAYERMRGFVHSTAVVHSGSVDRKSRRFPMNHFSLLGKILSMRVSRKCTK